MKLRITPEETKPFFKNREDYERFRQQYQEAVVPYLIKSDLARLRSEERAKHHHVD